MIFPVSTPSTIAFVIEVMKFLSFTSSESFFGIYSMPLSRICLFVGSNQMWLA